MMIIPYIQNMVKFVNQLMKMVAKDFQDVYICLRHLRFLFEASRVFGLNGFRAW